MIRRYTITLGASTTAGGKVISAHHNRAINGVPVAREDDWVQCPKCKSKGVIKPDGPRNEDTFNGKQVALSDDLCICKCVPPPRLVASQNFVCQTINADWHAAKAGAVAETAAGLNTAGSGAATESDGVPLVLLDSQTEEPHRYRAYKLELKDKVIEGTTDQNGATKPLTAAERAAVVKCYIVGETTAV